MSDIKAPIDVIYADFFNGEGEWLPTSEELMGAFRELQRRAKIEARRDAFNGVVEAQSYLEYYQVRVRAYAIGAAYHTGEGPDYWTALAMALDAAGAP